MKKVFVIGNSCSVWTKEYIKNTHIKLGNKVYVTDYVGLSDEDKAFYQNLGVNIVSLVCNSKIKKFFKYRNTFKNFAEEHKGEIDIIDIQSPPHSYQSKFIEAFIDTCNAKTIITFWGSDILRLNDDESKYLKGMLDRSQYINIGTLDMHDKLRKYFGNIYDEKCVYVEFGSPALSEIEACTLSKVECKELFGLNPDKITIAIGYNGKPEQQHLQALAAIDTMPDNLKERVELILHIGSSTNSSYLCKLKDMLDSVNISYMIYEQMMDLKTISKLRIATDIMLHAQVTDGLSGTIRECVYAGSVLINPSWIKYGKFDRDGVDYIQYSDFDSLEAVVEKVINKELTVDFEKNKKIMYDEFSWHAVERKWEQFFNE